LKQTIRGEVKEQANNCSTKSSRKQAYSLFAANALRKKKHIKLLRRLSQPHRDGINKGEKDKKKKKSNEKNEAAL